MQVHFGLGTLIPEWTSSLVCIGTFDGVHRGHQAVIRTATELGAARELPVIVVTFDRHPAAILSPRKVPPSLRTLPEQLEAFARLGVGMTLVLPFDAALSRMSAGEFFDVILRHSLAAKVVVVGHDFAFGNGREGTTEWLQPRIETVVVPPYLWNGERVSSTGIRERLTQGDIPGANDRLGQPFRITGFVVKGQQLGRELGFPTVNLARSTGQVLPPDGVYAAMATTIHGTFGAALAIGYRPAVDGQSRTIEAFLIDYPGHSLYGTEVRLDLYEHLREERNFPSLDRLKAQMSEDVREIRDRLASLQLR
ncbi:MAG: riboflavin biosynthesis protein RibF [Fimbriimonadaceae bacterium]|nr:riboflavin biosynthesis protein RibF [Fimbriimonadaceae bacterium]